jgi:hypothetical protein
LFETTIRVVGGLLGAHELSGDKLFLDKALELADRMLIAFNRCEGPAPQAHTLPSSILPGTCWLWCIAPSVAACVLGTL